MSTAFDVVFGIFVAMILAIAVLSVRWAVQRDRAERARNRDRSAGGAGGAVGRPTPKHRRWRPSPPRPPLGGPAPL